MFDFAAVNYIGVILATVAAMALGFAWYAPALFGKAWMAELGKSQDQMGSWQLPMIVSLVTAFVMAFAMDLLWIELGVATYAGAAAWSLIIGIVFVGFNTLSDYLYSGQTMKLLAITGGYRVVMLLIMGLILIWM